MTASVMVIYGCRRDCPNTQLLAGALSKTFLQPNVTDFTNAGHNRYFLYLAEGKTVEDIRQYLDSFGIEFTKGTNDRLVIWKDSVSGQEAKYSEGKRKI